MLVIDGDPQAGSQLGRFLQEHGYRVDVCSEARDGFRMACEIAPDCIVCTPELPDIDGAWVVRRIRTEPSSLAKVPILFVGEVTDASTRAQAFAIGVDVFLSRPPLTNAELVSQVDALIAMARRLDGEEAPPSSTSRRGSWSAPRR